MIRGRRAQNFYVIIIIVALIVLLTTSYFSFVHNQTRGYFNPEIGNKQESIIKAHFKANSIEATMGFAADRAAKNIIDIALRTQTDIRDTEGLLQQEFTSIMRTHPDQFDATYSVVREDGTNTYTFSGLLRIPVEESFATLQAERILVDPAGIFAVYPVRRDGPTEDQRVITSLFGNRNVPGASANHPGIDLRGRPGEEVLAPATGEMYRKSSNSVYFILRNNWECAYFHVDPYPTVPLGIANAKAVQAGEVVAVIEDIREPHLHVECWNNEIITPETAASALGEDHVSKNTEHTEKMSLSSLYSLRNVATLDPYCLFPQSIRKTIRTSKDAGVQKNLQERDGNNEEEKLLATCNAYAKARILEDGATLPPIEIDVSEKVTRTLEHLNAPYSGKYGSYSTLRDMIEEVSREHGVDPFISMAMVVQESEGLPNRDSKTGVCGLFQVTQNTAHRFVDGKTYNGHLVSVPETDTALTREHCDAYLQTQAGVQFIKSLLTQYRTHTYNGQPVTLTHQIAYMAAAYNGGTTVVWDAIKKTNIPDPDYEQALAGLTPDTLKSNGYSGEYFDTQEELESKVEEITDHGRVVAAYYTQLGGAVPLLDASATRFGLYTYPAETAREIDVSVVGTVSVARAALATCETADAACVGQPAVQLFIDQTTNVRRCTNTAEKYARIVDTCRADWNTQSCACRIPTRQQTTTLEDESIAAEKIVFATDEVQAVTQQGTDKSGVDWMGQLGDSTVEVVFALNGEVERELHMYMNTQEIQLKNKLLGIIPRTIAEGQATGNVLYLTEFQDEEVVLITVLQDGESEVCTAVEPEQYCFSYDEQEYSFWIDHPVAVDTVQTEFRTQSSDVTT